MKIIAYILLIFTSLSILVVASQIGKERKPITPGAFSISLIIALLEIFFFLNFLSLI